MFSVTLLWLEPRSKNGGSRSFTFKRNFNGIQRKQNSLHFMKIRSDKTRSCQILFKKVSNNMRKLGLKHTQTMRFDRKSC